MRATAEGLAKGAVNATMGSIGDGVEDAASSLSGKVTSKLTDTALGKEVFKKD
jgi:hypothetical protein